MIDIIMWFIIISLFILSFIGILYPVIPSSLIIWSGFLLYHFFINSEKLSVLFWIMMGIFTVILFVSDIVANSYFVKRFGGSKRSERVAGVAVIISSFIVPPFGILFIPPLTVLIIEIIQRKTFKEALFIAFSSFIGFVSGTIAKALIQLIMIIWFFIVIIF